MSRDIRRNTSLRAKSYRIAHLDACRASGKSNTEYCADQRLSKTAFYRWKRKLKNQGLVAADPTALIESPAMVAGSATIDGLEMEYRGARTCEGAGDARRSTDMRKKNTKYINHPADHFMKHIDCARMIYKVYLPDGYT